MQHYCITTKAVIRMEKLKSQLSDIRAQMEKALNGKKQITLDQFQEWITKIKALEESV